jgi:hypothetical protein
MGALIGYENLADAGTVTNNSDGTNVLSADNVLTRQVGKVMRQTLTAGQSIILDFDLGSDQSISYVGVFGHNIPAGTYQVLLGSTSGGSEVKAADSPIGTLWQGTSDDQKQQHVILDQTYTARYVRVILTATAGLDADLGRVWIDDPWTPRSSVEFEHRIVDPSREVRSYGQSAYTFEMPTYRENTMRFPSLTEAEALGSSSSPSAKCAHHMETVVGKHSPLVVIPETSGADSEQVRHKLGFYGRLKDASPLSVMPSKDDSGGWRWTKRLVVQEEK